MTWWANAIQYRHKASRTHSQTGRRRLAVPPRDPSTASCTATSRVLARLRAWMSSQERHLFSDDCLVTAHNAGEARCPLVLISRLPANASPRCCPMDCSRQHIVRVRDACTRAWRPEHGTSASKQRRQIDAAAGCHASDGRPSAASLPLAVLALASATVGVRAPGGRTQRAARSTGHSDTDSALHPARASRLICQSLCDRPCCQ